MAREGGLRLLTPCMPVLHPAVFPSCALCSCGPGNPVIASDLKKQCYIANQTRAQGFFKLHKENF